MFLISETDATLIKVALTFLASSISDAKDLPENCRQHWADTTDLAAAGSLVDALTPARSDALLEAYRKAGGEIGDCIRVFATPNTHPLVEAAREKHRDGEVEFDDHVVLSEGEDSGAYALAWVWVENPEGYAGLDDEGEDE